MHFLERFWTGCGHCRGRESCPLAQAAEQDGLPFGNGRRLVLLVLTVFILPLIMAIVTAFAAGTWFATDSAASLARWQIGGLLAGMAVGVALAKLLIFVATRKRAPRDIRSS